MSGPCPIPVTVKHGFTSRGSLQPHSLKVLSTDLQFGSSGSRGTVPTLDFNPASIEMEQDQSATSMR